MKKPKKMFLHPLISEIIAHSLHLKKRRNFALRSHTRRYVETVTYQSIVFASTAIKHALESKVTIGKENSVLFDADSYKGMHPFSTGRRQLATIVRATVRVIFRAIVRAIVGAIVKAIVGAVVRAIVRAVVRAIVRIRARG